MPYCLLKTKNGKGRREVRRDLLQQVQFVPVRLVPGGDVLRRALVGKRAGTDYWVAQHQCVRAAPAWQAHLGVVPKRPKAGRQVAPGGKAHHGDLVRVDVPLLMAKNLTPRSNRERKQKNTAIIP